MGKTKLDHEEQELLEAYESGEFESDLDADRREYLTTAAEETFKKDKRINIRISSRDLEALQRRALEEGLPYQSLEVIGRANAPLPSACVPGIDLWLDPEFHETAAFRGLLRTV